MTHLRSYKYRYKTLMYTLKTATLANYDRTETMLIGTYTLVTRGLFAADLL